MLNTNSFFRRKRFFANKIIASMDVPQEVQDIFNEHNELNEFIDYLYDNSKKIITVELPNALYYEICNDSGVNDTKELSGNERKALLKDVMELEPSDLCQINHNGNFWITETQKEGLINPLKSEIDGISDDQWEKIISAFELYWICDNYSELSDALQEAKQKLKIML